MDGMRTKIEHRTGTWNVVKQLETNESNTERYECVKGKKTSTFKLDIYSGQVIKEYM